VLPLAAPTRADSVEERLLLFRTEAADQAHVAFMPDTAWPISGHPPGSSRDPLDTPVLMSSKIFRHFSNDSLAFVFLIPT
jgi:hypothetical protein